MKIIFDKTVLSEALTPAMSAVSSKNVIPATSGILITTIASDKVSFVSYDLEKGVYQEVPAIVLEQGSFVISAVKFNQIVHSLDEGEVSVQVQETGNAKIIGGKSEFSIPAMKGSDFPSIPELEGDYGITIQQSTLKNMINRTIFAVAQTDQRPVYCGVYFEIKDNKLVAVSCDSFRLAYTSKVCEMKTIGADTLNTSFIVPGKTLLELMKFLDDGEKQFITIKLTRKHAIFKFDDMIFFTRLLEGQYIDYNRYVPKDGTIFVNIDTSAFMNSLERAALISEEKSQVKNYVKCKFEGNLLMITATAVAGNVYDEVVIDKTGDDLEICFTCRYLLEALRACNVDKIKLSMSAPLKAMLIEPAEKKDGDDFLFVTLPTRMK